MGSYESWDEIRRSIPLNEERVAQYGRLGDIEQGLYDTAQRRRVPAAEIARVLGKNESDVWTVGDRDDDLYLFALARHVAALGGHLEVRAVFDDEEVLLLSEPEARPDPAA